MNRSELRPNDFLEDMLREVLRKPSDDEIWEIGAPGSTHVNFLIPGKLTQEPRSSLLHYYSAGLDYSPLFCPSKYHRRRCHRS